MDFLRKLPRAAGLSLLLVGALLLDGLAYGFLKTCPSCTTFSQFISSQAALSAPILATLTGYLSLTRNKK